MTDKTDTTNPKPTPPKQGQAGKAAAKVENEMFTLSAQMHQDVKPIILLGANTYALSKAGFVRFCILYTLSQLHTPLEGFAENDEIAKLAVYANHDKMAHTILKV